MTRFNSQNVDLHRYGFFSLSKETSTEKRSYYLKPNGSNGT